MIIAANWKMNEFAGGPTAFSNMLDSITQKGGVPRGVSPIICPPPIFLATYTALDTDNDFAFGGQDCSTHDAGAFTGEISAQMLRQFGASYCIIGHSERREYQGETNALIAAKAAQAQRFDLTPIICVGELSADMSETQRAKALSTQTRESLVGIDVEKCILAYEPVWAIGSGQTPTAAQIRIAISAIQSACDAPCPVLYGGSVNPSNAREIYDITNVGGVLVGGASLKSETFLGLIYA